MTLKDLNAYGWHSFFQRQLPLSLDESVIPVRVMEVQRSGWNVAGPGIDMQVKPAMPGDENAVAVGDWLLVDTGSARVLQRLQRTSLFKRRAPGTDRREQLIAANVDTLFILSSCNQDFNEARIERYLAIGREAGVMSVIVLTKADLTDDPQIFVRRARKLAAGQHVEFVNALDAGSVRCLDPWLGGGQTIALLGSSGVGKSTLCNTLLGGGRIATQAIREDDAKGRHTTTARTMRRLPGGAWLLDTPGMRELQLTDVKTGLDDVFAEISRLADDCRFADCTHESEPGCAVRRAIKAGAVDEERVRRWRKLVREEAYNSESIAERRARGRSTGRLYKSIIGETQRRKGRR